MAATVDHFALKPLDVDELKLVLARLLALRSDNLAASRRECANQQ
jgi:hypothetical protein